MFENIRLSSTFGAVSVKEIMNALIGSGVDAQLVEAFCFYTHAQFIIVKWQSNGAIERSCLAVARKPLDFLLRCKLGSCKIFSPGRGTTGGRGFSFFLFSVRIN